jgi:hypothetical protein
LEEVIMIVGRNSRLFPGIVLIGLITGSAAALGADAAPDIKGKWVGKTYSIIAGSGAHWPSNLGTFDKPGLNEKDLVFDITGQENRRFWGVTRISGGTEATEEPFIGELYGSDNSNVVIADTDGYINGKLENDMISFCYMHTGGKSPSTVISCTEIQRTP